MPRSRSGATVAQLGFMATPELGGDVFERRRFGGRSLRLRFRFVPHSIWFILYRCPMPLSFVRFGDQGLCCYRARGMGFPKGYRWIHFRSRAYALSSTAVAVLGRWILGRTARALLALSRPFCHFRAAILPKTVTGGGGYWSLAQRPKKKVTYFPPGIDGGTDVCFFWRFSFPVVCPYTYRQL